jgi:ABC transporter substrate binding protein
VKRRAFITLLGGAAAVWPLAAQAQQARTPVLGFLGSAAEADYKTTTAALRRGLNEAGYVEKQNLVIEYRWADFQYDRLPALAAELVKRPVDAIFATGSVVSALAAKAATTSKPIVFANGSDPVEHGLVASLNRPGGNVTGISFINSQLGPKRIQLLRLLNPRTAVVAVLVNPKNPNVADAKTFRKREGGAVQELLALIRLRSATFELHGLWWATEASYLRPRRSRLTVAHPTPVRSLITGSAGGCSTQFIALHESGIKHKADMPIAPSHVPARSVVRGQDFQRSETRRAADGSNSAALLQCV